MREKKQENQIKPSKPKSKVWEYFDDCFDGKHVKCRVCEVKGKVSKYTVTDGGTKTLRDHIKNAHKKEWSEMEVHEEKRELVTTPILEAMTPPSLEHTLVLASSLKEVLTMFMEEASKLCGKEVGEENTIIKAETLNGFMAEEVSEYPKQFNETITAELEISESLVLDEDHLSEEKVDYSMDTDNSILEKEKCEKTEKSQHKIWKYDCSKCNYETHKKSNFDMHELFKHGEREFMCDQCDKRFFTSTHLKEHVEGVHGEKEHCSLCDYKTTSRRSIEKHIAINHFPKSLMCSECTFTTSDNFTLRVHVDRLHTPKENWPKCNECDYKSSSTKRVRNHFRKVHQQIKFKCIVCPNLFTERNNMQAHMKKIHKDIMI